MGAGWPGTGRYINVRRGRVLSTCMVSLQLRDPLELFASREGYLFPHGWTSTQKKIHD